MQEIWKDIFGYEGLYQISNFGRVKSLNYNHTKKEKVLCEKHHKSNYDKIEILTSVHEQTFLIIKRNRDSNTYK